MPRHFSKERLLVHYIQVIFPTRSNFQVVHLTQDLLKAELLKLKTTIYQFTLGYKYYALLKFFLAIFKINQEYFFCLRHLSSIIVYVFYENQLELGKSLWKLTLKRISFFPTRIHNCFLVICQPCQWIYNGQPSWIGNS